MPSGSVLEGSSTNKTNFLHVKSRAKEIEDLYASAGLAMSPTCGLAQLIENAKTLADRWLSNQTADSSMIDVFYAFSRQDSYAKNIFRELELRAILRRRCLSTSLQDPPDIVLTLAGGTLGIACKKIYSENNGTDCETVTKCLCEKSLKKPRCISHS